MPPFRAGAPRLLARTRERSTPAGAVSGLSRSTRERGARDDILALLDGEDLIRGHIRDRLHLAGRPPHVDSLGAGRAAEPEVDAQIVLTQVARACLHVPHLRPPRRRAPDARADCRRIARRAAQADEERMSAIAAV